MTDPQTSMADPWQIWREAAQRPAIDRAIAALYAELDAAVKERGPVCWASGRCCNFNAHGHLLYVTGLEIAWFLSKVDQSRRDIEEERHDDDWPARLDAKSPCPFQVNSLCTTHTMRPLGCRVYFCQRGTEQWQQELYETFQSRLRLLHDEHHLPYRYLEWRGGLMEAQGQ